MTILERTVKTSEMSGEEDAGSNRRAQYAAPRHCQLSPAGCSTAPAVLTASSNFLPMGGGGGTVSSSALSWPPRPGLCTAERRPLADDSSSDDSAAASDEDEASSAADSDSSDGSDGWSVASDDESAAAAADDDDSSADDDSTARPPAATRSGRPVRPLRALSPAQGGRYASIARGAVHATDSPAPSPELVHQMLLARMGDAEAVAVIRDMVHAGEATKKD